ncbi:MAG TPA: galactitol-1-phosphate 5-dehydrogenase [Bacteroidales bacterium]|jgi:L-iditol 2-dehydrogenase|nr:galactitol-1-phosphate 5-dehydrogenase [Bacteroidales bacterium]HOS73605.1 galactitol-1-phosphate 5-dehydrogenase [Bacteroidales bacterium]HQH22716.1 galactitol-1-phosphate 5-dehydrogenase [Bacteroidales bacterium]HQJ82100.1 galactitol-1-phosphate 5-dehydrogenase [Bacteroidales bacterium]
MKALVLEEYNRLVYRDWPDPEIADNEVLVRIRAAAICGSDVHGMDGSTGRRIPPVIMGHEASGIIEETGSEVRNMKKGDRVTFDSTIYSPADWYSLKGLYNLSDNRMVLGVSTEEYRRHGAFAEYLNVPEHILYRLPDDVSYTQAAMVEPLAVAAHAAGLASPSWNDSVAVIGSGMIGLSLIQVLRSMGCGKIFAVDTDPFKLGLALRLGADQAFDPREAPVSDSITELTAGRGADLVFEAVGTGETLSTAVASVRKGGTVVLVGNLSPEAIIPLQNVVTRQIRLQGSCAICGEFPAVLDMMARGEINTDPLISAEAPLSEGAEWFRRLYAREPGLLKVVLHP